MHTPPYHIADDESLLTLYVADELPPGDRAAVDARLAREPALRAALAALESAWTSASAALSAADRAEPARVDALVGRTTRAMRQSLADRAAAAARAAARPAPRREFRMPLWAYPVAAAAAIIVGFYVWDATVYDPKLAGTAEPELAMSREERLQRRLDLSRDVLAGLLPPAYGDDAFDLSGRFAVADGVMFTGGALDDAEHELQALQLLDAPMLGVGDDPGVNQ